MTYEEDVIERSLTGNIYAKGCDVAKEVGFVGVELDECLSYRNISDMSMNRGEGSLTF